MYLANKTSELRTPCSWLCFVKMILFWKGVLNKLCDMPDAEANNLKLKVFEMEALSMCPDMRRKCEWPCPHWDGAARSFPLSLSVKMPPWMLLVIVVGRAPFH